MMGVMIIGVVKNRLLLMINVGAHAKEYMCEFCFRTAGSNAGKDQLFNQDSQLGGLQPLT